MVDNKATTLEEEADVLLMAVEEIDVATNAAEAGIEVVVQMIVNIVVVEIALEEEIDKKWQTIALYKTRQELLILYQ